MRRREKQRLCHVYRFCGSFGLLEESRRMEPEFRRSWLPEKGRPASRETSAQTPVRKVWLRQARGRGAEVRRMINTQEDWTVKTHPRADETDRMKAAECK